MSVQDHMIISFSDSCVGNEGNSYSFFSSKKLSVLGAVCLI